MNLEKLRQKVLEGLSINQGAGEQIDKIAGDKPNNLSKAVLLGTLQPFDRIKLRTLNSEYDVYIISPGMGLAFIQGGKHLPTPVEAVIRGTHLGGLLVIDGMIETGFGVEFRVGQKRIVTSTVEDFTVQRAVDRLN